MINPFDRDNLAVEAEILSRPHPLSLDTRRYFLDARRGLAFLPAHGKNGGLLSLVAERTGVKRQMVHQTIYAKPDKLFGSGGTGVTRIWTALAATVFNHHLYGPLESAFKTLHSEGHVELMAPANLARFFLGRAEWMGLQPVVVEEVGTTPITYDIHSRLRTVG